MKKISYKNKNYKPKTPLSGPLPSAAPPDEGYSANFSNIGRGLSLPGEQAIPMPESETEREILAPKSTGKVPVDYNNLLDLFVQLGDDLDESGEHALASFADFLLTKVARQNREDYEALLKDLVLKISNSDVLNKNNLIVSAVKAYNQKFLELSSEYDDTTAKREAYQLAFEFVERDLGA